MKRWTKPTALILTTTVLTTTLLAEDPPRPDAPAIPRVKLETTLGDIVLELNREKAPVTVENFLQYVADGFYDGLIFHRVIPTFMIQGGGYDADMNAKTEGVRPPIKNEGKNGLKNERGTIAMARSAAPDSATCQFFINVKDNAQLDPSPRNPHGYAVFGTVVEGLDVVDKIRYTKCVVSPKDPGQGREGAVNPDPPVVIKKATILDQAAPPAAAPQPAEDEGQE